MRALLLLALLVACVQVSVGKAGGWTKMSQTELESDSFQASVLAATVEYNAKFAGEDAAPASVRRIVRAQQQVVAGMNYQFKALMSACDECQSRTCVFQVWYRAWVRPQAEVTSVKC